MIASNPDGGLSNPSIKQREDAEKHNAANQNRLSPQPITQQAGGKRDQQ
jgi:hypothetical protein